MELSLCLFLSLLICFVITTVDSEIEIELFGSNITDPGFRRQDSNSNQVSRNDRILQAGAVGLAFLVGYTILAKKQYEQEKKSKERLSDYPDCGTRNEIAIANTGVTEEEETCTFGCNFTPVSDYTTSILPEVITIPLGAFEVNVEYRPRRLLSLPDSLDCLNGCPFTRNVVRNNILLYKSCSGLGLTCAQCYLLANSYLDDVSTDELISDTEIPNSTCNAIFIPDTDEKLVFSYCLNSQYQENPSWTVASSPLEIFSYDLCNQLLCAATGGEIPTPGLLRNTQDENNEEQAIQQRGKRRRNSNKKKGNQQKKKEPSIQQFKEPRDQSENNLARELLMRQQSVTNAYLANNVLYPGPVTPWLCSIKFKGFRGRHRCGATLLSAPPRKTILVSAAHCNYICKDRATGSILEMCCCREASEEGSCKTKSSYCGKDPAVYDAKPFELEVMCGAWTLEPVPEAISPQEEVVLYIEKITNHPDFVRGEPIKGNDIAVYHVSNPEALSPFIATKDIYPACLPKTPAPVEMAQFSAWIDPEPMFRNPNLIIPEYVLYNYVKKRTQMIRRPTCSDPASMGSNTFYPAGTVCYNDPKLRSCVTFGNSGSSVVHNSLAADGKNRYTFVGPLSMSKGCDQTEIRTVVRNQYGTRIPKYDFQAENSAVFTDAICFMDWIAKEYDMLPPLGWTRPARCSISYGDINDANQKVCRTNLGTTCNFEAVVDGVKFDRCKTFAHEGFSVNIFQCIDTNGNLANCANNCKGVDPNSVVVGGLAVAFAASAVGISGVAPMILGGLGVLGVGGTAASMMMSSSSTPSCGPRQCRIVGTNQCCDLVRAGSRFVCPVQC